MYAIVDIAGKQVKVQKNDHIRVPKIAGEVGKSITFDRVLLLSNNGDVSVGQPLVEGAKVKAKILGFDREKKITVFKKKRRKGYRVKRGHRQDYAMLEVEGISGAKSKTSRSKKKDGA